jgi:hypothetical protein
MKESFAKKFESKTVKVILVGSVATAAILSYFLNEDLTKQPQVGGNHPVSIEIAKSSPTPEGIEMSKIGRAVLLNGASETFYVCIQNVTNKEEVIIDRVVLSPITGTEKDNYTTYMTDSNSNDVHTNKTKGHYQILNDWGKGNNTADALTDTMVINPEHSNYVTFYASMYANTATSSSTFVSEVMPFYRLVSDKTFTNC